MKDFDLKAFIKENFNPLDDPMLSVGISAGIKVGFNKAKALYEPRWISVEEALPELRVKVWVYFQDHTMETAILEDDGVFKQWECSSGDWDFESITHWMPLPSQPKAEG